MIGTVFMKTYGGNMLSFDNSINVLNWKPCWPTPPWTPRRNSAAGANEKSAVKSRLDPHHLHYYSSRTLSHYVRKGFIGPLSRYSAEYR